VSKSRLGLLPLPLARGRRGNSPPVRPPEPLRGRSQGPTAPLSRTRPPPTPPGLDWWLPAQAATNEVT